jgi:hypothetical protein
MKKVLTDDVSTSFSNTQYTRRCYFYTVKSPSKILETLRILTYLAAFNQVQFLFKVSLKMVLTNNKLTPRC